jgi:hypothetical protein
VAAVLATVTCFCPPRPVLAAGVQTVADCDKPLDVGPGGRVRITQSRARASVEISQPGAAGRKVEVEYGDELYRQTVGKDGLVRLAFALTAPNNQFVVTMSEAAPMTCTIAVPDFGRIFRAVLRWHDPVQLDLNVLEPNGRMNETGNISGTHPNIDQADGIGQMDIVGAAPTDDATGEMSYVADGDSLPPDSFFGFKVDYVTRGSRAMAPYCGDNALAAPRIDFIRIQGGTVTIEKLTLNRIRCGDQIPSNRRLMPIR